MSEGSYYYAIGTTWLGRLISSLMGGPVAGGWFAKPGGVIERTLHVLRRVICLTSAGYSAADVSRILQAETGISVNPQQLGNFGNLYLRTREDVEGGTVPQAGAIAACVAHQFLSNEEIAGGTVYGPPAPTPPTPEPPPVLPPPAIPPPTPPDPSTSPPIVLPSQKPPQSDPTQPPTQQTGRRLNVPSLLRSLLTIYLRYLQWQRARQAQPGQGRVTFQIPSFQLPPGGTMPYFNTSIFGEGGGAGGWSGVLQSGLNLASQLLGPSAQPGGMPIQQFQQAVPQVQPAFLDVPFVDIMPQGAAGLATLTSPFATGGQRGARAKIHVRMDPITGRPVWFRPAGRPLLWSSDLAATKRVRKIASRARRARGGR